MDLVDLANIGKRRRQLLLFVYNATHYILSFHQLSLTRVNIITTIVSRQVWLIWHQKKLLRLSETINIRYFSYTLVAIYVGSKIKIIFVKRPI